jgi:RecA-family ATPase
VSSCVDSRHGVGRRWQWKADSRREALAREIVMAASVEVPPFEQEDAVLYYAENPLPAPGDEQAQESTQNPENVTNQENLTNLDTPPGLQQIGIHEKVAETAIPTPEFCKDDATRQEPVKVLDLAEARRKIEQIVQERASAVRAGVASSIGRDLPKWLDTEQLLGEAMKPINWQVKHLWTEQAKILLAAEPKVGKTWLVCSIALAVSTGSKLWNSLEIAAPGPVGLLAGEDDKGEIGRRLHRMCRAEGRLMTNAPVHFLPAHGLRMNRERDQDFIRRSVQKLGLKLIVYDPFACLMDGDENSKEAVAQVLNPAGELAKDCDCCVMIVHHLGKQSSEMPRSNMARVRGSSFMSGWFTCGLFVMGDLTEGRVTIEVSQRVSGKIPKSFPVDAIEVEEESIYGLGTIRFQARMSEQSGRVAMNERLVEEATDRILSLAKEKKTLTMAEVAVHLGYGKMVTLAALKRLILEMGMVTWQKSDELPDGRVIRYVDPIETRATVVTARAAATAEREPGDEEEEGAPGVAFEGEQLSLREPWDEPREPEADGADGKSPAERAAEQLGLVP